MLIRYLRAGAIVWAVFITAGFGLGIFGCSTPQVSQPTPSAPEEPDSGVQAWNPFVVSEPGGRIYLTYFGGTGGSIYSLFFNRSLDGGTTWLREPVRLDTPDHPKSRIGFHRLETIGDGGVSVTWSIEGKEGQYWRIKEARSRRSSDSGTTWSQKPLTRKFSGGNYPVSLVGADGALYLVWTEQTGDKANTLRLQRTAPGAGAWSKTPVDIPGPESATLSGRKSRGGGSRDAAWPVLASDAPGRLFVAWQQETPSGSDIYFNQSRDGGTTWLNAPVRLNARPPEGYTARIPALVVDNAGGVYVVWEDFRHDSIDLYLNRSMDGGATWLPEELRLTPDRPKGATSSLPFLSADRSGRLYLVWQDGREVPYTVYFNRSLDRGTTWLPHPIRLDHHGPDTFSYAMRLGHDDTGHVYVVWWEGAKDKGTVHFARSSDAGATWPDKDVRLDGEGAGKGKEGSRFPWLSADGTGRVYVAWSSDQTGVLKLYLNRSTDHGATWLPREIRITR